MFFFSKNKKNNVYPCKPQFYYIIKVGFKGVKIIQGCFCDFGDAKIAFYMDATIASNDHSEYLQGLYDVIKS